MLELFFPLPHWHTALFVPLLVPGLWDISEGDKSVFGGPKFKKFFLIHFEGLELLITLTVYQDGGGGVLLGILGEGVLPGSSNPDPISDQKM